MLLGIATAAAMASLIDPRRPFLITTAVAAGIAFGAHARRIWRPASRDASTRTARARIGLWLVCDKYRSLLGEIEDAAARSRDASCSARDELSAEVHAAYDQGFSLDQNAYEGARRQPKLRRRRGRGDAASRTTFCRASGVPAADVRNGSVPH